jgi:hypothetical protein
MKSSGKPKISPSILPSFGCYYKADAVANADADCNHQHIHLPIHTSTTCYYRADANVDVNVGVNANADDSYGYFEAASMSGPYFFGSPDTLTPPDQLPEIYFCQRYTATRDKTTRIFTNVPPTEVQSTKRLLPWSTG